jgi:hypothetical protein
MSRDRVGRNDPCPCGSGRKYKRCCMDKIIPIEESTADEGTDAGLGSTRPPGVQAIHDAMRQAFASQEFQSLEEAQAFASKLMGSRNHSAIDYFDGLSADQMRRFLYHPLESPDLVEFPEVLDIEPRGPMPDLFCHIVEAIDEKGLKLTPKGNLPRALSQEAARRVLGEERYEAFTRIVKIRGEEDYGDLFVTRLVGIQAGLIRKQHGRFFRTRCCDALLASGGLAAVYPHLLKSAATRFNWAYRDRYPELGIVQHSFLFTLRMLSRYGGEWRDTQFYADAFIRAFPAALMEAGGMPYSTPEQHLGRCYVVRALERFAAFCGLVEIDPGSLFIAEGDQRVRALPLLGAAVRFEI